MEKMSIRESFVLGIRSSTGYFISTFLFGLMFGVAASAIGLTAWQSVLMSVSVYSASAQFAALEFWNFPLPLGTIMLSVFLVSTRNILLGMSMTHHFDQHSSGRKILCLFFLNDPGVVTALRQEATVDKMSYITGYGVSLFSAWLVSTWIGAYATSYLSFLDFSKMDYAGPLMLALLMVLFLKGSSSNPWPWIVSGLVALVLFESGLPAYWILPLSVVAGVVIAIVTTSARTKSHD